MATTAVQEANAYYVDLLQSAGLSPQVGIQGIAPNIVTPPSSTACSILRRAERDERRFKNIFQWLMVLVGVIALLLLAGAILVISRDVTSVAGYLTAAGSVTTGAGAIFLGKQRADARRRYDKAQKAILDSGC